MPSRPAEAIPEILDAGSHALASWTVARLGEIDPGAIARGDVDLAAWTGETRTLIVALSEALAVGAPELFVAQVEWSAQVHRSFGTIDTLRLSLVAMRDVLDDRLPEAARRDAIVAVERAIAAADAPASCEPADCIEACSGPHVTLARHFLLSMLEGRRDDAIGYVLAAQRSGIPLADLYRLVIEPVMYEVGRLWQIGQLGVHEEHLCTAITEQAVIQLSANAKKPPHNGMTMIASTISGDLHSLGVRMVADLFEQAGWKTHYLGPNTPPMAVVEAISAFEVDLVAVSAKLIYHIRSVRELVAAVRAEPAIAGVPILVGGAPFKLCPSLWRNVGADGSAPDARSAVTIGAKLVGLP